MTGIRVRALTESGHEAMRNVMSADNGRTDWKVLLREQIERDEPLTILIQHKNRLAKVGLPSQYLKELVEKQLTALGAVAMIDYEVRIV